MNHNKEFAFVIPSFPRDYHYIYDLINQMNSINYNIDIYIIFSNISDYNLFEKKNFIKHFILPENIITNNIVTYKKFYALNKMKFSDYEYFIVCDSEVKIIEHNFNTNNIRNKYKCFFNQKIIFGGNTNNHCNEKIMSTSSNLIKNKEYIDTITENTQNFKLYIWWSDLPFYKRDTLPEFFSLIDFDNVNPSTIMWYHFDHIIYCYYLIIFHDFTIYNISNDINYKWSLEGFYTNNINDVYYLKNKNYGFGWAVQEFYDKYTDFLNNEKTIIIYHLDRKPNKKPDLKQKSDPKPIIIQTYSEKTDKKSEKKKSEKKKSRKKSDKKPRKKSEKKQNNKYDYGKSYCIKKK